MGELTQSKLSNSLGVVKRFDFSSGLQRMSVITMNHYDNSCTAFIKGSPEMIHSLSVSDSIPADFYEVLEMYTKDGLRVLALGYKKIQTFDKEWIKQWKREEIESEITFIGFLIMENMVKPETNGVIEKLQRADIGTIMATGDNGLTGVAVGRKWGIINPYKTWFLAERVKNENGRSEIKWIKIEKNWSLEDYLNKNNESHTSIMNTSKLNI